MAVADETVISRLQDGAAPNAVDNTEEEPFALQSLCMSCYENVSRVVYVAMIEFGVCLSSRNLRLTFSFL